MFGQTQREESVRWDRIRLISEWVSMALDQVSNFTREMRCTFQSGALCRLCGQKFKDHFTSHWAFLVVLTSGWRQILTLDLGWILVEFWLDYDVGFWLDLQKHPDVFLRLRFWRQILNVVSTSGFQSWINVWFSTLDQRQVFNVGSTIHIFCYRHDGCHRRDNNNICWRKFSLFFFVILDLGWILVGIRLSPLQPEINQNTTLELRQVFNLKTTLVGFPLKSCCNLKSTKIQRWKCIRFST